MPTKGDTAAGAVSGGALSDDYQFAFYIGQMDENGTLQTIHVDLDSIGANTNIGVALAMSSSAAVAPTVLVPNSGASRSDVAGRDQFVFTPSGSATLVSGSHIWLLVTVPTFSNFTRFGNGGTSRTEWRVNTTYPAFVADMSAGIEDADKPIIAAFITYTTAGGASAVLSSATQTNVEATTATLGCTSDTDTGTLRMVLAATNIFTGVTGAQIKAGQNAAGNTTGVLQALSFAFSGDTTPSLNVTGLTRDQFLYGAMVVETGTNVFSNVLPFTYRMAEPVVAIADIIGPNSSAVVADASGVGFFVFSHAPGSTSPTLIDSGTLSIASGDCVVPCGNATLGATVEVLLGWTVSGNHFRAGGPFATTNNNA